MFTFFYPGRMFPAISVTGQHCELACLHCNHHYLDGMVEASTPEALYGILKTLASDNGVGALISGGSTRDGKVPLDPFLPVISRIKQETDLILNVHTGFIGEGEAMALAETGVDVVSLDVVGAGETVRKVYGLERQPEDYFETLRLLKESGIPYIVPHLTIGLHFGVILGEFEALRMIKEILEPDSLVINVLVPTRGTGMEKVTPPGVKKVVSVIKEAVTILDCPIFLGCMRPKGVPELEIQGEEAGLSGIVIPSREGMDRIRKKRDCQVVEACCAVLPVMLDRSWLHIVR